MKEILQKENNILRNISKGVLVDEIKKEKIKKIISDMKETLENSLDGVAIAAPQIGVNLRIFVVSRKILDKNNVFINPKIVKISKEKIEMEEGCLSVRGLYGKVIRHKKAKLESLDEHGKLFKMGAGGLLAQIFQHEIDHLDGTLFIDKALDLIEIPKHE
jgi:peptide deformylase